MLRNKTFSSLIYALAIFSALLFSMSSCSSRKYVYFNDLPEVKDTTVLAAQYQAPVVQQNDVLSITVQTIDPNTSAVVNQAIEMQAIGASSATGGIGSQMISGFQVDEKGEIQMSLLGKVKVEGLTISQVRDKIVFLAQKYYKDPNVQVRFANFRVTVLGEVARPATYTVPSDRVSVLDALGLAGDMLINGRRDNVLLMREIDGKQNLVRLDLNNSQTLSSPYFFLKQNDVLYVEPGKGKAAQANASRTQTIAIAGTIVSLVSVLILRFF